MSNNALPLHEPHDGDAVEIVDGFRGGPQDPGHRGKFGWLISGGVHAAIILVAMVAVCAQREVAKDAVYTRVEPMPVPDKAVVKPPVKRDVLEKPVLPTDDESETPTPNSLDVVVDQNQSESDSDSQLSAGRDEAVADAETGGAGIFVSMGAGSNSAGLYGQRGPGGRKRGVQRNGGSEGSEAAVEGSLRWFKRHQSPNGSWETDRYYQNCTAGAKCEPGGDAQGHGSDQNVAMTGYAVMCFLGAGYDHKAPNRYKAVVRNGLDWLRSVQKNDGYFGLRNYEHPIATMALAEAYAMTGDPELRGPAQKAIDQIIARQNRDEGKDAYAGGLGWDYIKATKRNDSSVTGWNVMALKSGLAGGLTIGKGMEGSRAWLERSWKASNSTRSGEFKAWQEITQYDKSHFAYCWTSGEPVATDNPTGRESIGLACAIFLGRTAGDPLVESLANTVMATQLPKAFPTNAYYLYYNTMAMFQVGGDKWTTWNGSVRDLLVKAQRTADDCTDGSWDWGGNNFIGAESGRLLTTAYNTMTLEVYYRQAQLDGLRHRK